MRWRRERTRGLPPSANGASSMHLWWDLGEPAAEVAVDLEVLGPPVVPRLYFWALQATFVDGSGRRYGGGHLGLQWHPSHPGSSAVCWGGYAAEGGELRGTESDLPSATGNPNTRDLPWAPQRAYRLRIARSDSGWTGEVDGRLVRTLHAGGDRLTGVVVWSEVFARCDDPSVTVRWSRFDPPVSALRATYQEHGAGGCANTTAASDGDAGARQVTNADRLVPHGGVIRPRS